MQRFTHCLWFDGRADYFGEQRLADAEPDPYIDHVPREGA